MPRKNQKQWIYSPSKAKKPKVPEAEKQMITQQCQQFIDSELKPRYLNPNPPNKYHIIEDIFGKWYHSFYYLCYTYRFTKASPTEPAREEKFTRLEYTGKDTFNIAYMRHTGKWWEVNTELSLEQALEEIKNNPIFHPQ